ncbi:hypothetical protein SGRA_3160 [Saprospira grandis str. Lewin]|uniref:Uncharacterized protein n=1 Tax=Saprospira grandis (strain Lewin) TaxID=984262 RepID=H6L0T2_SAPGL|nr:hypothetical protein SGRA_3160 [Saprospira grandis str. Lewin]
MAKAARLNLAEGWTAVARRARPKRAALKGRANSELRNSPTRAKRVGSPKKKQPNKTVELSI